MSDTRLDLQNLREEVDNIDASVWQLLEKRFALLDKIIQIKKDFQLPILDERREKDVLAKIRQRQINPEIIAAIEQLYKLLFELSRKYQAK